MPSTIDIANAKWKKENKWHFQPTQLITTKVGFDITRSIEDFGYWTLTPSGAYWLCATLNNEE